MFRLTKSVVVSEPLQDFADLANDVTTDTHLKLKGESSTDHVQHQNMTSVESNVDLDEQEDSDEDEEDIVNKTLRVTLARKVSCKLKDSFVKRETMRMTQVD